MSFARGSQCHALGGNGLWRLPRTVGLEPWPGSQGQDLEGHVKGPELVGSRALLCPILQAEGKLHFAEH